MLFKLILLCVIFTILPLKNDLFLIKLFAEDETFIYLNCTNYNSNLICEFNNERINFEDDLLIIEKRKINEINTLIIKEKSEIYYFEISYLSDFSSIYVNKTIYHIGYYIESKKNNAECINLLSKEIKFNKIFNEINIKDVFDFSLSLFSDVTIDSESPIEGRINMFVKQNTYPYINYQFSHYSFALATINVSNTHYFILDNYYYTQDKSISKKGELSCYDLFLPNCFSEICFSANLIITIDNVNFIIVYKINIGYLLIDFSSYVNIQKAEPSNDYEKKIIYSC